MNVVEIPISSETRLAVFGDTHACPEQFEKLQLEIPNDCKRISVGDCFDKGFGLDAALNIVKRMKKYHEGGQGWLTLGNHDVKWIKKLYHSYPTNHEILWLAQQPKVLSFIWPSGRRLTCVHAGICPVDTWASLETTDTTIYVRRVDFLGQHVPLIWKNVGTGRRELVFARPGKNWHEVYDGRFGYVAAGHDAQKDGKAKFYQHSCNLDSAVFSTGILSCQIFNESGLDQFISVSGPIPPSYVRT